MVSLPLDQILVHIITSVIHLILFGYFFSASALDSASLEDNWPYLVLAILPAIRLLLIGHWGQVYIAHLKYRDQWNLN